MLIRPVASFLIISKSFILQLQICRRFQPAENVSLQRSRPTRPVAETRRNPWVGATPASQSCEAQTIGEMLLIAP